MITCVHDFVIRKYSEVSLCLGGGDCDPGESHENDVIVYGRSEGRRERVVLDTLPYSSYRVRYTQHIYKNKPVCYLQQKFRLDNQIDNR